MVIGRVFESEGNLLVVEAPIPVSENDSSGGRGILDLKMYCLQLGTNLCDVLSQRVW